MKRALFGLGAAALAVVVLLTLSHLVAGFYWPADLIELFRPYVAIAAIVPLLLFGLSRSRLGSVAAGLVLTFNLLVTVWPAFSATGRADGGIGIKLNLATFNCLGTNPASETFASWARRAHPDVIALQEIPSSWQGPLNDLHDAFPYRASQLAPNAEETDILSRFPIVAVETYAPTSDMRRAVHAIIDVQGRKIDVYAVHPNTLHDAEEWNNRNEFLALAGQWIGKTSDGRSSLVMGDWNLPPWSPFYRPFLDAIKSRPLESQFFPTPTRILANFNGVLVGSPIDHIAGSEAFESLGCELGPDLRSDHRPLLCHVRLISKR